MDAAALSAAVTGGLRSRLSRMKLLFAALALALLAAARAAEGELEPPTLCQCGDRASVAPGLVEGLGGPGRVRRGPGGGHGCWPYWLHFQITGCATAGAPAWSWDPGTTWSVAPIPAGALRGAAAAPRVPVERWGAPKRNMPSLAFTPGARLGRRHRPC